MWTFFFILTKGMSPASMGDTSLFISLPQARNPAHNTVKADSYALYPDS